MLGVIAVIFFISPAEDASFAVPLTVLRWVLLIEAGFATLFYFFWHHVPGLTARWVFPHIDGSWEGTLFFNRKNVADDGAITVTPGTKEAKLHVHQTMVRIRLILETDESTSETLVVRPDRDPDFSRFRLFYIFENKSRDGLPNTARCYRGTAAMEIQPGSPTELVGTYFTDQGGEGTFHFTRQPNQHGILAGMWRAVVAPKGAAIPIRAMPRPKRVADITKHTTEA